MAPNTDIEHPAAATSFGLAGHPRALRTLFFTELWERFSYYGMRALLTLFMVAPIANGGLGFTIADAGAIYGSYTMAVYMLSIPGGFIADRVLGAKRAVLWGGSTIALGHYALAIPSIATFYLGLILIALGTGLFKPNISALVGALYGRDDPRRDAGFSLFYVGINIGAFLAPFVTGTLAQGQAFKNWLAAAGFDPAASWHWGFGAAGVGMTVAMLLFIRHASSMTDTKPAEPPPASSFARELAIVAAATLALLGLSLLSDVEGYTWLRGMFLALPLVAIAAGLLIGGETARQFVAIGVFFIAAMLFWAIFEQQGSTIALFADKLTRNEIAGISFPSAYFQSVNPLCIIAFTPIAALLWMKLGARQPSAPVKFAFGLGLLSLSFALMVPAAQLAAEGRVSPLWLIAVLTIMTLGEILLSPVGLASMTRIAPARMVGLVLGIWFLATAFGNKLAGVLVSQFSASDPAAMAPGFLTQAAIVGGAALLMLFAAPWVNKLSAKP